MDPDLNTCIVAVVADYEFFSNVGNGQESTVSTLIYVELVYTVCNLFSPITDGG